MRRLILALGLALFALAPAAHAADFPAGSVKSDNLDYVKKVPGTVNVVDGNFDSADGRDVMVATGRWGLQVFDLSDPRDPKLLDSFQPAEIAPEGFWQNEDIDLDTKRNLAIMSLDPRHTRMDTTVCPARGSVRLTTCPSGFYIVDYSDPSNLKQVGDFVEVPAGHTTTCIEDCTYTWTGGPARRDDQAWLGPFTPGGTGDGRPIWVTDLRDPENPKVFEQPVDLYRNHGVTDYSHDVQVDRQGIAWSSGRGGVRGYATSGRHFDADMGKVREATPYSPIRVAGGGMQGVANPAIQLAHNSQRPTGAVKVRSKGKGERVSHKDLIVVTEEEFNGDCAKTGRLVINDLSNTWGGRNPNEDMPAVDSWHPSDQQNGEDFRTGTASCSGHYFDLQGSLLAMSFYGQGTRFLDLSDASDIRQVGYYRVAGTGADNPTSTSYSTRQHDGLIYVFDISRGIEILEFKGNKRAKDMPTARISKAEATRGSARASRFEAQPIGTGYVCPLFTTPGA